MSKVMNKELINAILNVLTNALAEQEAKTSETCDCPTCSACSEEAIHEGDLVAKGLFSYNDHDSKYLFGRITDIRPGFVTAEVVTLEDTIEIVNFTADEIEYMEPVVVSADEVQQGDMVAFIADQVYVGFMMECPQNQHCQVELYSISDGVDFVGDVNIDYADLIKLV